MKHKHYDCIVAWAEGKAIQAKLADQIDWHDFVEPIWNSTEIQYRIKPELKPDVIVYLAVEPYRTGVQSPNRYSLDNLRLTFDGETGKLKSAEVI